MTKKRIADLLKEEVEKPVLEAESGTDKPATKIGAKSSKSQYQQSIGQQDIGQ